VRAPNNHGKSAILKSLYDTFGAQPHKIDDSWKRANTTSIVEFTLNDGHFVILKSAGTYAIIDANRNLLQNTSKISNVLAPYLANLWNFRLVVADKGDQVRIPPPAYIFAPFYVDQDNGWSSFSRMYLPNTAACSPSTIPASGQTNTTKPLQRGINCARLCYRLKPSGKQLATRCKR
jgi:hypothetical protein